MELENPEEKARKQRSQRRLEKGSRWTRKLEEFESLRLGNWKLEWSEEPEDLEASNRKSERPQEGT